MEPRLITRTTGDGKSVTQQLSDSTSKKPGEEGYIDTAKKLVNDGVEYVKKTVEGILYLALKTHGL